MDLQNLELFKSMFLILLLILASISGLAQSTTLTGGEELCGDFTTAEGENYDTVTVTGEVDICDTGATIETNNWINITNDGFLNAQGEDGADGGEETPGDPGTNGNELNIISDQVEIIGTVSTSGGDGGDGGSGGGNNDGADGGDGGNAGNLQIDSLAEEIIIEGSATAEGGSGGSGGAGGPGGGAQAGSGGDGGDGGTIELRATGLESPGTISVDGGSGGGGSTFGADGEDGTIIEELADISLNSFDSDSSVERFTELQVYAEIENSGDFEGIIEIDYLFNEELEDQDSLTVQPGETETVPLTNSNVTEERGDYQHVIDIGDEQLERPITVEDMFFVVRDIETNSPVDGDTAEVNATIENIGELDGGQNISYFFDNELDTSLDPSRNEILAGQQELFEFTTDVEGLDGDFRVNVTTRDDEDSTSVVVGDAPFFEVEIIETNEPLDVTDTLTVNTSIENIGGLDDQQDVEFFFDGNLIQTENFDLDGGEEEFFEFTYDTGDGDGGFNDIEVASEDDSDAQEVLVGDEAFFNVTITDINDGDLDPGDIVEVDVLVENTGDAAATKDVEFIYDEQLEDTSEENLDGGEQNTLNFQYDTSGDPEGAYNVKVQTEDDEDVQTIQVGTYELAVGTGELFITQVTLEEINNPSGNDDGYADYTESEIGQRATLARGETYDITLETDDAGGQDNAYMSLFFDWSQDVDFDGEEQLAACDRDCVFTTSFTVPEDAELGDTRLRVIVNNNEYISSPYEDDYPGEAEDYSLEVTDSTFEITNLETESAVVQGEETQTTATIENTGSAAGTDTVEYYFGGDLQDDETISLGPGDTITTSFSYNTSEEEPGNYIEEVTTTDDSESSLIDVLEPANFQIVNIFDNTPLDLGETLDVKSDIENIGDVEAEQIISLLFEGSEVDTETLTLESEETRNVDLNHTPPEETGIFDYTVETDDDFQLIQFRIGNYSQPDPDATYEYISQFDLTTVNNNNDQGTGTDENREGYLDFTDQVAEVERGETYTITVESEAAFEDDEHFFNVFPDWNQDLNFDEEIQLGSCTTQSDGCQVTGDITIPETAELGETRLRSILRFEQYQNNPDDGGFFGQIQDYNLEVQDEKFEVTEFETPSETIEGRTIRPNITVTNTGQLSGETDLNYTFDGEIIEQETNIALGPGEQTTFNYEYTLEDDIGGETYLQAAEVQDDRQEREIFVGEIIFNVEILSTNSPVTEEDDNDILEVEAEITNDGDDFGEQDIEFYFDDLDTPKQTKQDFGLNEGESDTILFTEDVSNFENDDYPVEVVSEDDVDSTSVVLGDAAFFEITILDVNSPLQEGDLLEVDVEVENVGGLEDTQDINLDFESSNVDTITDITLGEGETQTETLEYSTSEEPGEYTIEAYTEDEGETDEIRIGDLPFFNVTITDVNNPEPGEILEVDAEIENTGDLEGTQETEMLFDGNTEDTETLTIAGQDSENYTYTYDTSGEEEGIYPVEVLTENTTDDTQVQLGGYELSIGDTEFEYLESFELEQITQTSDPDEGYYDYTEDQTGQKALLQRGETYTVTMSSDQRVSGDYEHFFNVFVDWNQNVDFDQDEINIGNCVTDGNGCQVTGDINVPSTAELGDTRLRAFLKFEEYQTDPFEDDYPGQTHDYSVQIVEPDFQIDDFERPSTAFEGQTITPNATITNEGGIEDTQTIEYIVNDEVKDTTQLTIDSGETKTAEFEYTVEEEPGSYTQAVETEDDTIERGLEVEDGTNLRVNEIIVQGDLVEGQENQVDIEVENTGGNDAENVELSLTNSEFVDGAWTQHNSTSTTVSLSAEQALTTTVDIGFEQGPNRLNATIDPEDEIPEADRDENTLLQVEDVSSYNIFYGGSEKTLTLAADEDNFNSWISQNPEGNIYFADTDASFDFIDLDAPSNENDLELIDEALDIESHNDSVSDEWDESGDGFSDETATFEVGGNTITDVPVVNSTTTEDFQTGILYDTDQGTPYDGSQDLVIVTEISPETQGEFGVYDYEAKVPANLRTQAGLTESVTIFTELD